MARLLYLKRRLDSLRTLGVAVEYFPHYVNRTVELHSLDVVLLSFILRGRGHHQIDDETFAVTGASLGVTHYGQHHSIVTDARGMDVINVYLDLEQHPLPVLPLLLPLHPRFQHRLNRIVQLRLEDPHPLAALLFAIQRELAGRPATRRRCGCIGNCFSSSAAGTRCGAGLCRRRPPRTGSNNSDNTSTTPTPSR
jgi:hypothetical protein